MRNKFTLLLATILLCAVALTSCRYANDASDTLYKETKASTLLNKYEYFKDVAAALDAKVASIDLLEGKVNQMKKDYEGQPRSKWAREDREQNNLNQGELVGLKLSYNTLCAEYNAQMAKLNWAFCNVGTLPEGATKPLPREFKPYITQ
jgi:two-component SAPR family response regulator